MKKYATYKLLDYPQQRAKRDETLSKKGDYLLKILEEKFETNEVVLSEDEIIIEPWQISQQDEDFIYLTFDYGI